MGGIDGGTGVDGQTTDTRGWPEDQALPGTEEHEASTSPGVVTTIWVEKVSERVIDLTVKGDGKVTDRVRSVVSKDGKTLTNTDIGADDKGKQFHSFEVFDKPVM